MTETLAPDVDDVEEVDPELLRSVLDTPVVPWDELSDGEQRLVQPTVIGPTWSLRPEFRDRNLLPTSDPSWFILPTRSIGWEVIAWCHRYLRHEDGRRWEFTPEQARFVLWWYALDSRPGAPSDRFRYLSGLLVRIKGAGKDPLAAALCLVEAFGPCRYAGYDKDGEPVAMKLRDSLAQIAAVSERQTKNTMRIFAWMISDELKATEGIDVWGESVRARDGRRSIEAVTSSPKSLEGGRSTFVFLNEVQNWLPNNGGVEMYGVLEDNSAKIDGRWLAAANQFVPGQQSVCEAIRETWQAVMEGRSPDISMLLDSIEAKNAVPLTPRLLPWALRGVIGDAYWLKIPRLIASILNPKKPVSESRRKWLNQVSAAEDAVYSPGQWDGCRDDSAELDPRDQVVLGFDGGETNDSTALVAVRTKDRTAFLLALWEKPEGAAGTGWEVDRDAVDSAIHEAFADYEVVGFYGDLHPWQSNHKDWSRTYRHRLEVEATAELPTAWDMRQGGKKNTDAHEQLMQDVLAKNLRHDGDARLTRHVMNARRRVDRYGGIGFGKESKNSKRKVDAYAALLLAWTCLRDWETKGKPKKNRSRGLVIQRR